MTVLLVLLGVAIGFVVTALVFVVRRHYEVIEREPVNQGRRIGDVPRRDESYDGPERRKLRADGTRRGAQGKVESTETVERSTTWSPPPTPPRRAASR